MKKVLNLTEAEALVEGGEWVWIDDNPFNFFIKDCLPQQVIARTEKRIFATKPEYQVEVDDDLTATYLELGGSPPDVSCSYIANITGEEMREISHLAFELTLSDVPITTHILRATVEGAVAAFVRKRPHLS